MGRHQVQGFQYTKSKGLSTPSPRVSVLSSLGGAEEGLPMKKTFPCPSHGKLKRVNLAQTLLTSISHTQKTLT